MGYTYRNHVAFWHSMHCFKDQTKESVLSITSIIYVFFLENFKVLLTHYFEMCN